MKAHYRDIRPPAALSAALFCAALLLVDASAVAQNQPQPPPATNPFGVVGRWVDDTLTFLGSGFQGAKGGLENLNHEAGVAAKTTASAAKDAADAVVRIPTARVVSGHANCTIAANGAPDCGAAASSLCKGKGFASGTSIDITSAEECPVQVMLGRRAAQPGECKTVNFVTRAFCQ